MYENDLMNILKNKLFFLEIKFSLPTFATENPICDTDKLACGSKECIAKEKFCDGIVHCPDGMI